MPPTNGVPAGAPLVSYPAVIPYVIAVGGTTLLTNANGTYDTETSWYAGGGGVSQFESASSWRRPQAPSSAPPAFVACRISPTTLTRTPVRWSTSMASPKASAAPASSPLALGTWARAVSELGFAGPRLYALYDGATTPPTYPTGGFHDIIAGANGLYTATPGFDFTTGLGTPIINQLVTDLSK